MNIILRLAWRNLWRHKKRSWITISAMVFSNVLLVFMLSLQFGTYQMMIDNSLNMFSGHLQIQDERYLDNPKPRYDVPNPQALVERLKTQLDIENIAIRGSTFSLLSSEKRSFGAQILGVQPEFDRNTSTVPGLIVQGRYLSDNDAPEIILGTTLAKNLKLTVGDEVTLLGSDRDGSVAAGFATVVGLFEIGLAEVDRSLAQLPLGYFQALYGNGNHASYIVIRSDDALATDALKYQIEQLIADKPSLAVRDWDELQPGIRQAIIADLSGAVFMYGVLILLVAFSVMNTLLMSVLERTREFGTVMALGLRPGRLSRLILLESTLMSLLGLMIGVALGMALTTYVHYTGFYYPGMEEMASKFNLPSRFYPSVGWISALLGPGLVMLFSVLASVYPALRIRRLEPLEAMRAV